MTGFARCAWCWPLTPLRVAFAVAGARALAAHVGVVCSLPPLCCAELTAWLDRPDAAILQTSRKRPFILSARWPFGAVGVGGHLVPTGLSGKALAGAALHWVVYAAALLAVLHFFWMRGKNDFAG